MKFSEKIKMLRKSRAMTQADVAHKFGITRQAVSQWEMENSIPSIETIKELSLFFHIPVDTLVGDADIFILSEQTKMFEEEIMMYFLDTIRDRVKHSFEIEDRLFEKRTRRTLL